MVITPSALHKLGSGLYIMKSAFLFFTKDKHNFTINHITKSTWSRPAQSKSHGVKIFLKNSAGSHDSIVLETLAMNGSRIFTSSWGGTSL